MFLVQVDTEAKTATEIKLLKQRTYITVSDLQNALEGCLLDVVYAINVFTDLYGLAPDGDYDTNIDWKDSILTDTDTELQQKLQLQSAGILSKAEVRAWYTGESVESAQIEIDKMIEESQKAFMGDLFTANNNGDKDQSLESNPTDDQDKEQQEEEE